MAFNEGFNFRATLAFVTDPADTQHCPLESAYPTTAGGVTFGWEYTNSTANDRDRSDSVDARLAGIVFHTNNRDGVPQQAVFRVDLPATGDYEIAAAFGDMGGATTNHYAQFQDTTTEISTVTDASIASGAFVDASGVERTSAADWVSNNVKIEHTFASTIFRLALGQPTTTSGNSIVAHLSINDVAAGAVVAVPLAETVAQAFAPAVAAGAFAVIPLATTETTALAPTVAEAAAVAVPLAETVARAFAPAVQGNIGVSATTRAAVFASETAEAFIVLVTIDHDDLSLPIRVCSDAVDMESRGNTFTAMPFERELPGEDDTGVSAGTLAIQNVSLEITEAIRSINTPPSVLLEVVRAADPDTVEMSFDNMRIAEVRWDALIVSATVDDENFLSEPYPKDSFTPGLFPGVF